MESSFSVMSSSKMNACSDDCATNDSAGCILDTIVENQLVKNGSKPPETISESKTKCSIEELTSFEIPEPIQTLDDILSEFEELESLPLNPGSSVHENQSEDDGYMSLNGRRCDVNNMRILPNSPICINFDMEETDSLPDTLMDTAINHDFVKEDACYSNKSAAPQIQNTLPKTKSKVCTKSNYSSLPCSSLRSNLLENNTRVGSCSGERNILGIDISAVHNAVLRGGFVKLPEPIVNEHPVTIYPGRKSPNWSTRLPRSVLCSTQAQQENCHKNKHNSNSHPLPLVKKTIVLPKENVFFNIRNEGRYTEYENEKYQFEQYDLKEMKSFKMLSHDTLDNEGNYSSQLVAISTPAKPQKLNSIAWEISFDESKNLGLSKMKKKVLDSCLKNKGSEKFSNISKNGAAAEFVIEHTSNEKTNSVTSYNDKFINESSETNDPVVIYDIKDNIKKYASTCDSMLGKGTFIIRKRKVQSSSFLSSPKPFPHQNSKTASTNNKECSVDSETSPNLKDSVKNLARASLSLDLEFENFTHNQKGQYKSPLQKECIPKNFTQEKLIDHKHKTENVIQSYSSTSCENVAKEDSKDFPQSAELNCSESIPISLNISRKNNETYLKGDKGSSAVVHLTHNQAPVKVSNDIRSPGPAEHISNCTTPHRELAPPLEEEEEQCSESQSGCAPLRQIENNISALLRGDIAVVRIGESSQSRRSLNYRPGVHKSESAKEMLLSQNAFGPLPPSPPSLSPEINDCGSLPPLPPSPSGTDIDDNILDTECIFTPVEVHSTKNTRTTSELLSKRGVSKYRLNDIPLPPLPHEHLPPAVPPHRRSTHFQTIRSRSIDSNYTRKCPMVIPHMKIILRGI